MYNCIQWIGVVSVGTRDNHDGSGCKRDLNGSYFWPLHFSAGRGSGSIPGYPGTAVLQAVPLFQTTGRYPGRSQHPVATRWFEVWDRDQEPQKQAEICPPTAKRCILRVPITCFQGASTCKAEFCPRNCPDSETLRFEGPNNAAFTFTVRRVEGQKPTDPTASLTHTKLLYKARISYQSSLPSVNFQAAHETRKKRKNK
eukprot:1709409-Rhodomonas_salina.2